MNMRRKTTVARRTVNWVFAGTRIPRLLRIATISGLLWAGTQFADRFGVSLLSQDWKGVAVFVLIALVVVLSTEIIILVRTRPLPDPADASLGPGEIFADSLINYAAALSAEGNRRDQAILELRSWSSRLLHLTGAAAQRADLGQIALTAATALEDRLTQASILIDDLGWSLHEVGNSEAALENIEEALLLIGDEMNDPMASKEALLELKVKALRHKANIRAKTLDLQQGRALFREPRRLAQELPPAIAGIHLAQLDHSEAELISRHLTRQVGDNGQVDPTGNLNSLLRDAIDLAERAEDAFARNSDHEREAKVLKLRVGLLAHETRKQPFREAAAKLERLQREVSRNLK